MDKNTIKSFAIESRRQMVESVKYQASLIGITAEDNNDPISKADGMETYDYGAGTHSIFDEDIEKRKSLVNEIENKGFDNVVEEVAYTWFNRIIAIRYMEVNDYLPTRTRVLSSEIPDKIEPDIIAEALDLDLDYTPEDKELIIKLLDENNLDVLFQFLFIKQCNKLNEILPGLFEKTNDYMELLLNISFTDKNGIVRQLIDNFDETDFLDQVEIIGWLYQFYNSELKDQIYINLKKGIKIGKNEIPAATQLFTPDWIVKYLVENSLGRLWLKNQPEDNIISNFKYYVNVEEDKNNYSEYSIKPTDIKIIDPCMGSGHILTYIFDVLMEIYLSEGFTKKDAAQLILTNNLFGLDIDNRAYQLAYFALMMKSRSYVRDFFKLNIHPSVFPIEESNNISNDFCKLLYDNYENNNEISYLINLFKDAKIYGSILNVKQNIDFESLSNLINSINSSKLDYFKFSSDIHIFKRILSSAKLLSQEYDVVVTNPPYLGSKGMDNDLKKYLKVNHDCSKSDLCTVFLERGLDLVKYNGFNAMVTMQSWMFLSSFIDLRQKLLDSSIIYCMLYMNNNVMNIAFGTSATVFRKNMNLDFKSVFNQIKYEDIVDDEPISFPIAKNKNNIINVNELKSIPGKPLAFWLSENMIESFDRGISFEEIGEPRQGLATGDNKKFLRYWFEVDNNKIGRNYPSVDKFHDSNLLYIPYNKGGPWIRWYGNNEYVIKFDKIHYDILSNQGNHLPSRQYYCRECITWSDISSKAFAARYSKRGSVFDVKGSCGFPNYDDLWFVLAFLNSKLTLQYIDSLNPTNTTQVGDLKRIPIILPDNEDKNVINSLAKNCVKLSKANYDSFEISFDFKSHPFLNYNGNLNEIFNSWRDDCENNRENIREYESNLNAIFIDIYGLNNELDSFIPNSEIKLREADEKFDSVSFISYAVGCMFGRYSLDDEGLIFAGGEFNLNKYVKFIPDDDNILPILDTEYFDDDIVGRFVEFIKVCFGEENLEENLEFIAGALNKKGKTSREIIRNYFLTDFFKNHVQIYKKHPIYWQFDSGKQNAFKCLIYMHRYDSSIIARVRTDYLHKTQKAIELNLAHCDNIITNSSNKSEISKATKDKTKYIKQLDEIRVYDEALRHMATQNIEIDLDDGVKVNYAKFQKVEVSIEGERAKKVNLLRKI